MLCFVKWSVWCRESSATTCLPQLVVIYVPQLTRQFCRGLAWIRMAAAAALAARMLSSRVLPSPRCVPPRRLSSDARSPTTTSTTQTHPPPPAPAFHLHLHISPHQPVWLQCALHALQSLSQLMSDHECSYGQNMFECPVGISLIHRCMWRSRLQLAVPRLPRHAPPLPGDHALADSPSKSLHPSQAGQGSNADDTVQHPSPLAPLTSTRSTRHRRSQYGPSHVLHLQPLLIHVIYAGVPVRHSQRQRCLPHQPPLKVPSVKEFGSPCPVSCRLLRPPRLTVMLLFPPRCRSRHRLSHCRVSHHHHPLPIHHHASAPCRFSTSLRISQRSSPSRLLIGLPTSLTSLSANTEWVGFTNVCRTSPISSRTLTETLPWCAPGCTSIADTAL